MTTLRFMWLTLLQTLLRVLPFPCRTGVVRIGTPNRDSPVLLTGNFGLTVERVKRAMEGFDAWLLVANSRGLNVWCAASGGHLGNHDVVSVLKTSGIEQLVNHRQVILPQLAATGIEGNVIHRKTGWEVLWGPVYATSIPDFLDHGMDKTRAMSRVSFPPGQRLEMAVAWAFPLSLLTLLLLPFWPGVVAPLAALVWASSLSMFLTFPLYQRYARNRGHNIGFVFFNFGEKGLLLLLWLVFIACVTIYGAVSGDFSWSPVIRWGLISLIVLLVLGLDLTGSTPTYKSGLHRSRLLHIELDPLLCEGVGVCERVCPTGVFTIDNNQHLATLSDPDACVQCGACIVQCPCDALRFRDPQGRFVTPETVRRFKLNMLGTRTNASDDQAG